MDAAALTEVRTPAVAVAEVLDRLWASREPLECVIVGAGVQGRAHARTVADALEGVREVSVTFVSRSRPADLSHPWVESGSGAADEVLGRAGLVVVATSAGEPVVVDRQSRADATVLAVEAHTVDTRELHDDVRGDVVLDPARRVVFTTVGRTWRWRGLWGGGVSEIEILE